MEKDSEKLKRLDKVSRPPNSSVEKLDIVKILEMVKSDQFRASLKGDKGDIGLTGAAGEKGEKGDRGDIGPRGYRGDKGLDGKDGKDGAPGKIGLAGERGPEGKPGPRGEKGDPGPEGKQGPIGETGPAGLPPEHEINGRKIRFRNPNGTWGEWISLSVIFGGGFNYSQPSTPEPTPIADTARRVSIIRTAAESISALQFVYSLIDGTIAVADNEDLDKSYVIGIALNAGVQGEEIEVLIMGAIKDSMFSSLQQNLPILLNNSGHATNDVPTTGTSVYLGVCLGDSTIKINIREPILLGG